MNRKIPSNKYSLILGTLSISIIFTSVFLLQIGGAFVDAFLSRPGNLSLTTLLPSWVRASSRVLLACAAEGLVLGIIALILWARSDKADDNGTRHPRLTGRIAQAFRTLKQNGFPSWGFASLIITPIIPLLGSIGVMVTEAVVDKPYGVITNYFPVVSQTSVIIMLMAFIIAVGSGIISLIRHERPSIFALFGIATNTILIIGFYNGQYAKLGYDQDRGPLPPEGYFKISEGLTAASAQEEMLTGTKLFSTREIQIQCDKTSKVARLTAIKEVQLITEKPLSLKSLNVVAYDAGGNIIPSVPIIIEVEQVSPTILYFWPSSLESGPTAHSAGFFLMKVRAACTNSSAEVIIKARAIRAQ